MQMVLFDLQALKEWPIILSMTFDSPELQNRHCQSVTIEPLMWDLLDSEPYLFDELESLPAVFVQCFWSWESLLARTENSLNTGYFKVS